MYTNGFNPVLFGERSMKRFSLGKKDDAFHLYPSLSEKGISFFFIVRLYVN